jgi:hypothetical protein
LREFFGAHLETDWSPYEYGEKRVGAVALSSTLQRIDYGKEGIGIVAEGRTGQVQGEEERRLRGWTC